MRRTRIRAMTVAVWAGVVVIGGVGAVLRFLVDRTVSGRIAGSFPYGTLVVNLSGALLLGFLSGVALSPHLALLAGTAFVGSYTTFSTWMLETQRLGEERQLRPAVANIVVSLVLGLAAALARPVDRRPPVSDEYLKLTAYFAERLRSGDRFLADALLDLYGESSVATSVVLRGIASFGPHHELRSDQSLSVSEDSPIAIAAVDRADKIAPLADRAVEMTTRGLVTLERARLLVGPDASARPDTVKLTVYVGPSGPGIGTARPPRRVRGAAPPRIRRSLSLSRRRRHQARTTPACPVLQSQRRRSRDDHRGRHRRAGWTTRCPNSRRCCAEPLFTIERAQLCKRDGQLLARPTALPAADGDGRPLWQKLMVYTSEATLHDGVPIHRAIVQRLFDSQTANGATVLRGIWGFHGDHEPHGDKLFQLTRQVPVTTIVVDSPERIAASFDIIDDLTDRHGLVTSELVPALVSIDGGERRGGTALARYDY